MARHDLAELQKRIAKIAPAVRREVKKALLVSAEETVALMKAAAPVESGTLRDTIAAEPGDHELAVRLTAGGAATTKAARSGNGSYDYATSLEWGMQEQHPQPFFFPAIRATTKRTKGRVTRSARKAAKAIFEDGR